VAKQDRLKWIGHPVWSFVATIAALIALYFAWPGRTDKGVKWGVVSQGPLVSDDAKGRLTVLFDGRPRKDLNLAFLRLDNAGYGEIARGDFERAVSFDLGAPVLRAEVAPNSTPDLGAVVSTTGSHVTLRPLLLNSGDSVVLKVFVAGPIGKVTATGRIQGVSRLVQSDFKDRSVVSWEFLPVLLSTLTLWWLFISYRWSQKYRWSPKAVQEAIGVARDAVAILDDVSSNLDLLAAGHHKIIESYRQVREARAVEDQLRELQLEYVRMQCLPPDDLGGHLMAQATLGRKLGAIDERMRRNREESPSPDTSDEP
jgi:hypothetical protein